MFVRTVRTAACLAVLLSLFACTSAPVHPVSAREAAGRQEPVWLVSNRFHTSIAVEDEDAPPQVRMLDPKAKYFVIGWGGRDLYMKGRVYPWQWLTTTILPTASALHVIPIRTTLAEECPRSEIIEFRTSRRGREKLRRYLYLAFARDKKGKVLVVGPGKSPISRFFAGSETYYLPKTCNLWVAKALKIADIPIYVMPALEAGNLLWQGAKHGQVISSFRTPGDEL
jgi:uncharacterized protein (TIGR02117 family)